ncbi:ComC/BlpC family leader-containing pheromone/bacteriocin [Streptococcus halichoeri]|nr:ComC/BlpC family leader-containing pheromone/bacteriocin [Streptococcus halichoeri]PZO96169.1 MAG: hypothetical protein DI617_01835 [Streptococcus pyogenes]
MDKKQSITNFSLLSEAELRTVKGGNSFVTRILGEIMGKAKRKAIAS